MSNQSNGDSIRSICYFMSCIICLLIVDWTSEQWLLAVRPPVNSIDPVITTFSHFQYAQCPCILCVGHSMLINTIITWRSASQLSTIATFNVDRDSGWHQYSIQWHSLFTTSSNNRKKIVLQTSAHTSTSTLCDTSYEVYAHRTATRCVCVCGLYYKYIWSTIQAVIVVNRTAVELTEQRFCLVRLITRQTHLQQ